MSRPFIALYLDEDVSSLLAEILRARGFDVETAREAGRVGEADADQLEYAIKNERALLSHNRAASEVLVEARRAVGSTHHGILLAARRSPDAIARRLLVLLHNLSAEAIADSLIYL